MRHIIATVTSEELRGTCNIAKYNRADASIPIHGRNKGFQEAEAVAIRSPYTTAQTLVMLANSTGDCSRIH